MVNNDRVKLYTLFVLFFLLSLILSFIDVIPARDVAFRYAPMAKAFACGDWEYAFHPRTPMALSIMAGIVCFLFKCSGFMACKIISTLFYSLTVFPVYGLCFATFKNNKSIAFMTAFLTGLCSHLIRLGYSGLRDSIKEFAIILIVLGIIKIYQQRNNFRGFLYSFVGAGLLILSRVDTVFFAFMAIGIILCFDIWVKKIRLPWRTVLGVIIIFLIISPNLIYNYKVVGYPVPEVRFGVILEKFIPAFYNQAAIPGLRKKNASCDNSNN